uniref:Uncharacterized protein n=1 Tax=Anguilla anguilla TaxID=7936 RepID=A0A0E9UC77_ANGAN
MYVQIKQVFFSARLNLQGVDLPLRSEQENVLVHRGGYEQE